MVNGKNKFFGSLLRERIVAVAEAVRLTSRVWSFGQMGHQMEQLNLMLSEKKNKKQSKTQRYALKTPKTTIAKAAKKSIAFQGAIGHDPDGKWGGIAEI